MSAVISVPLIPKLPVPKSFLLVSISYSPVPAPAESDRAPVLIPTYNEAGNVVSIINKRRYYSFFVKLICVNWNYCVYNVFHNFLDQ